MSQHAGSGPPTAGSSYQRRRARAGARRSRAVQLLVTMALRTRL